MVKNRKNILIKKSIRDILRQIRQYLAMILIATFAICLFSGLAANYHALKLRKDKLYKDGNLSDLFLTTIPKINKEGSVTSISEADIENIKNFDGFKNELEIEKRLLLPISLYPEKIEHNQDYDKRYEISGQFQLQLRKSNLLMNRVIGVYDENKKLIKGKSFEDDKNGIYLPLRTLPSNVKVGSNVIARVPTSILIQAFKQKYDIYFEKVNGKPTGRILYRGELDINKDKKNKPLLNRDVFKLFGFDVDSIPSTQLNKIKPILKAYKFNFDDEFTKDTFSIFSKIFLKSSLVGKTSDEKNKNDPFGSTKILNFIEKIDGAGANIKMPLKVLGYVMEPEVVDANSSNGISIADYDYFFKKFKEAVFENFKEEIAVLKMLGSIFYPSEMVFNGYEDVLKGKIYDNSFFNPNETIGRLAYLRKFVKDNIESSKLDAIKNDFIAKKDILLKEVNNDGLYNQLTFKLKDYSKVSKLKTMINKYYSQKQKDIGGAEILFNQTKDEIHSNLIIDSDIRQSRHLMFVFPIIFFIVAFLVIISTSLQIVLRERTQIGTLKALGFSNFKIYTHYIGRTILICFIGIIIGVATGPFILPKVLDNKYKLLYNLPSLKFVFPCVEVISLVLIFIFLVSFIMFWVCRHEVNMLPAKSMRPKIISVNFGAKNKKTSENHISKKIAFRNIKINIFRTFMAILGVMGCTALLISGMGINDTIAYGIDKDKKKYYNCDIAISYNRGSNPLEDIKKVEGVDEDMVENYYVNSVSILNPKTGKTIDSNAIGFYDNSKFIDTKKYPHPDHGSCYLPKKIANDLGIKVGDMVSFVTSDNIKKTFKVQKLISTFSVQGLIFSLDDPLVADISRAVFGCFLNVIPDYKNKIEEVEKNIKNVENVAFTVTEKRVENIINDVTGSIGVLTLTILIFAILLSATVLYNLSRLNLNERKREIATLKVLGFSGFEIGESILIETLFLTIIGSILGTLLGFPMLYLILKINETPIVSYIYYISWQTYVIGALSSIIVGFMINFYMSRVARKIKMVESLKSVE